MTWPHEAHTDSPENQGATGVGSGVGEVIGIEEHALGHPRRRFRVGVLRRGASVFQGTLTSVQR